MTPRGLWPIGKIIKAMPSPDDQTRIYQVKTRRGLETGPAIRIAPIIPMDIEQSGSPAGLLYKNEIGEEKEVTFRKTPGTQDIGEENEVTFSCNTPEDRRQGRTTSSN